MLEALVVTLREGVEAALLVGITITYLRRIGREDLLRTVYWALSAAVLGSIGMAFVLNHTGMAPELFEGSVMLVAAFFVLTMIWFMSKAAKTLKSDIETRLSKQATSGSHGSGSKIGVFLFVFLMVLREGA